MRGIPGVVSKEGHISKASALHNINKALSILQSKKVGYVSNLQFFDT